MAELELDDKLYKEKKAFVDEASLIFEEQGHSRISGQILAWLHVCKPEAQSFNDLVEHLNVSKASISNMTRLLLQAGFIEKVRMPGERQTYFKLVDHAWCKVMERQIEIMSELRNISAKYIELLKAEGEDDVGRLSEMHDFYEFVTDHFPESIEAYKKSCEG
ncbi:MarR family transcriptional regulator [Fodinibius sp. Rm-B-1B1-1]|uniref:GbsR/MarR family transcriptional regulator n=1 Tax=Fodinibius alkaliphilus TaxID=3140241 RepID=UPI00315A5F92